MEKEQKLSFIAFMLLIFTLGFMVGTTFNKYIVDSRGISATSYCKEIQIDTLRYDYQKNMYQFEIKIIK